LLPHVMLKNMGEANPPKRPATYDDLLKVPDHKVAEILDGELHVSARPASPHAFAASRLGSHLTPFNEGFEGPVGWWIVDEPELHLGPDVAVPDLAGWRVERMPHVPTVSYFTLAPDWVCEVVSPSTEGIDRQKKLRIYARERIRHCWLINPVKRTIEIRRLEGSEWLMVATHRDNETINPEPFDALPLPLIRLWKDPPG
jgi:Uma2 family endonuclease